MGLEIRNEDGGNKRTYNRLKLLLNFKDYMTMMSDLCVLLLNKKITVLNGE